MGHGKELHHAAVDQIGAVSLHLHIDVLHEDGDYFADCLDVARVAYYSTFQPTHEIVLVAEAPVIVRSVS